MKTGILFDLDGTLLDTLDDLYAAVNYTLDRSGCPTRSLSEVRRFVGNGAEALIRRALPPGTGSEEVQAALSLFQSYYAAHCQIKTRPYDGIPEALAVLRQRYPIAIVSNKPDGAVKRLCAGYFPGIYALGETAGCPRKPAADMVYRAMGAIGAERCIYVGDSEVDVQTAENAGVPCISVLWGFRDRAALASAGAEHFCQTPQKLPIRIDELTLALQKTHDLGGFYGK